jgi:hypothetical protein
VDPDPDALLAAGLAAYAAGDFAAAEAAWRAAADAGSPAAADHLRLLAEGDPRRQALLGRMAERENPDALWRLGVACVERADLPGVRAHWCRAADLDAGLAAELADLLGCAPADASRVLADADDGDVACRLGELCHATGRTDAARVWWVLARAAGSAEAAALIERLGPDAP